MIAILLGSTQGKLAQSFTHQGWQAIEVKESYAVQVNLLLAAIEDAFICIIPPSEAYNRFHISLGLIQALKRIITTVPHDRTGVLAEVKCRTNPQRSDGFDRIPLLWNREFILSQGLAPGFADKSLLPFESYVLEDKWLQMSHSPHSRWALLQQQGSTYEYVDNVDPAPYNAFHKTHSLNDPVRERLLPLLQRPALPRQKEAVASAPGPSVVTIVICCYQDGHLLPWAIRSLLAQTCEHWELLLIDDGSDPPLSSEHICAFDSDDRIRMIRNESNLGKAASLNEALAQARGQWFVELDADDWLAPDGIEKLHQQTLLHPQAALIYGEHEQWRATSRKEELLYMGRMRQASPLPPWDQFIEAGYPVAPRCFRTEALRRLGGWWTTDPWNGRYYEDMQIIARLLKLLSPAMTTFIPEPIYHRRVRPSSVSQYNKNLYLPWKTWLIHQLRTT